VSLSHPIYAAISSSERCKTEGMSYRFRKGENQRSAPAGIADLRANCGGGVDEEKRNQLLGRRHKLEKQYLAGDAMFFRKNQTGYKCSYG